MNKLSIALISAVALMAQGRAELFADGGYQATPVACMASWQYKEKLSDGTNVLTSVTGCVGMDALKPYPFYPEQDAVAIAALLAPKDSRTNTSKWCSTESIYNPTPQKSIENRELWGYCLDTATAAPTTSAPTPKGTASPTPVVTTNAPTTASPTPAVTTTSAPTPVTTVITGTPTVKSTSAPTLLVTGTPTTKTTSSPTIAAEASTPAPTPKPTTAVVPDADGSSTSTDKTVSSGPSGGLVAGIVIAFVLVAVALVMVVIFARKMGSMKRAQQNDPRRDIEGQ